MVVINLPKISEYDMKFFNLDIYEINKVMSLIKELPLEIATHGFDSGSLELRLNPGNDAFFLISPERQRVGYERLEKINPKRFEVHFYRRGFEDRPDTCVDALFVAYKQDPHTGIFLRTHPFKGF